MTTIDSICEIHWRQTQCLTINDDGHINRSPKLTEVIDTINQYLTSGDDKGQEVQFLSQGQVLRLSHYDGNNSEYNYVVYGVPIELKNLVMSLTYAPNSQNPNQRLCH